MMGMMAMLVLYLDSTMEFVSSALEPSDVWAPHPENYGGMGNFKIFPGDSNVHPRLITSILEAQEHRKTHPL